MKLEDKIKKIQNQFDIEEPTIGHFNRFEAKLQNHLKPKKRNPLKPYYKYLVAASFVLLFSFIGYKSLSNKNTATLANVSPELQQTESYFSAVIHDELKKVQLQKNHDNQKIIDDAMIQLQKLEKEYQSLGEDLKNSENKKALIYAMLDNYQQRIKILQNLLEQLEQFNQLKNNSYETQNI